MPSDPTTSLYRVLNVRPSADSRKIRAAYRALAKRFHPDVNLGDPRAEERTKKINRAYQILGDPRSRATYDNELVNRRTQARRRFWRGVAAGVATFMLIAGSVSLIVLLISPSAFEARFRLGPGDRPGTSAASPWSSGDLLDRGVNASSSLPSPGSPTLPEASIALEPFQKRYSGLGVDVGFPDGKSQVSAEPTPQPILTLEPARNKSLPSGVTPSERQPTGPHSISLAMPRAKPETWKEFANARLEFALRYPADVFTLAGADVENQEHILVSKDGRAILRILSVPNAPPMTLTDYRKSLMGGRYAGATFNDAPPHDHWFVLSGKVGEEMFYEHITFSCDRRSIHGWLLVYPRSERSLYDAILEDIRRSYRYTLDPGKNSSPKSDCAKRPQALK